MPFTQLSLRSRVALPGTGAPNPFDALQPGKESSSAWNLPMIGQVREREQLVDKVAIAEY
jgi:hypothetical protein